LRDHKLFMMFWKVSSSPILRYGFHKNPSLVASPVSLLDLAVRWNWQAVIRKRRNPTTGSLQYEKWEDLSKGFPKKSTKASPRYMQEDRHIKPTERKRRINSNKVYQRSLKKISDLTTYIHFMRDKGGAKAK
jgi:hypothetical protein